MKKTILYLLTISLSISAVAQQLLHNEPPYVNFPGQGYNGADATVVYNGGIATGVPHMINDGTQVADDIIINNPDGWIIDSIAFFAYQSNSGEVSTLNDVRVEILNGTPGVGTAIWGNLAGNNLMLSTEFTGVYRAKESNLTDSLRPLMRITADIGGQLLTNGQYWVTWQTGGTLPISAGPWCPLLSGDALSDVTGNGYQYFFDSFQNQWKWSPIEEFGGYALGVPMIVYGKLVSSVDEIYGNNVISTYPNPVESGSLLNINIGSEGAENMIITDMAGHTVYKDIRVGKEPMSISTEGLKAGIYLIKALDEKKQPIALNKLVVY